MDEYYNKADALYGVGFKFMISDKIELNVIEFATVLRLLDSFRGDALYEQLSIVSGSIAESRDSYMYNEMNL
jgi:hypothetical protein